MIETMSSDNARQKWGELITSAIRGDTTVIERYGKPLAVLVSHDRWQETQRQLRELRADESAHRGEFISDAELEAGLKERGLL